MIILILGVVPAILLLVYIYHLDKVEPEPPWLLLRLFIFGGLTTLAAGFLEEIGIRILDLFPLDPRGVPYLLIENFIVVGIAEEGMKHLALRKITWYHPAFNYRFDGVVYAATVALGFAAFENVMYILNFGLGVAPIRAVTAIPMHCICGIFMGHYYGEAKKAEDLHEWGRMEVFQTASVAVPVLLHGFYDFAAGSDDALLQVIFLLYVVILDLIAFFSVRRYAREDTMV